MPRFCTGKRPPDGDVGGGICWPSGSVGVAKSLLPALRWSKAMKFNDLIPQKIANFWSRRYVFETIMFICLVSIIKFQGIKLQHFETDRHHPGGWLGEFFFEIIRNIIYINLHIGCYFQKAYSNSISAGAGFLFCPSTTPFHSCFELCLQHFFGHLFSMVVLDGWGYGGLLSVGILGRDSSIRGMLFYTRWAPRPSYK